MDPPEHPHEFVLSKNNRPRAECVDCHQILHLCWGEIRKPYWRHASNVSKTCTGHRMGAESYNHKCAKESLCYALNNGVQLGVTRKCQCGFESILYPKCQRWATEITHTNNGKICKLDIAGMNDDIVVFGIEIFHSHKTEALEARRNIEWIELRADDIISCIDESHDQTIMRLNDISSTCCDKCLSENHFKPDCVNDAIIAQVQNDVLSIKSNVAEPPQHVKIDIKKQSLRKISEKLGYLYIQYAYACEGRRLEDCAIRGKYKINTDIWNDRCYDDLTKNESKMLWDELLRRNKCIRCEHDHNIKINYPYCLSCYRKTKNEIRKDAYDEIWEKCDEKLKRDLRRNLNPIFKSLPEYKGNICGICKIDYSSVDIDVKMRKYLEYLEPGSNYVKTSVFWWQEGIKKSCCSKCLDIGLFELGFLVNPKGFNGGI